MTQQYAITAPSYTGIIFVFYVNGLLRSIDTRQAEITEQQTIYLFKNFAPKMEAMQAFLNHARLKAVEVLEDITFDTFYATYGHKEGRKKAEAAWHKMNQAEQLKAYYYIPTLKTKKKISGEALPYPATYLNQARWND